MAQPQGGEGTSGRNMAHGLFDVGAGRWHMARLLRLADHGRILPNYEWHTRDFRHGSGLDESAWRVVRHWITGPIRFCGHIKRYASSRCRDGSRRRISLSERQQWDWSCLLGD